MDAVQMFLTRHERMHVHLGRLTAGLSEEAVRSPVHPLINPLAWLLWHVARSEDAAVNVLVCGTPQVLDDGWLARLRVARRDVGTGMSPEEARDLATAIDLAALAAYREAVGARTQRVLASLRPPDLDVVMSPDELRVAVRTIHEGQVGDRLEDLWRGMARGSLLVWLPLAHVYEHIGQADLIRGLLGRAGRF